MVRRQLGLQVLRRRHLDLAPVGDEFERAEILRHVAQRRAHRRENQPRLQRLQLLAFLHVLRDLVGIAEQRDEVRRVFRRDGERQPQVHREGKPVLRAHAQRVVVRLVDLVLALHAPVRAVHALVGVHALRRLHLEHLVRIGVEIVRAGRERLAPDAAVALRHDVHAVDHELVGARVDRARVGLHHRHLAGLHQRKRPHLHAEQPRIEPVVARREDRQLRAAVAFLALQKFRRVEHRIGRGPRRRVHHAFGQRAPVERRHQAHRAVGHLHDVDLVHLVRPRPVAEMPARPEHLRLRALLAFLRDDAPRRQILAERPHDHARLVVRHVHRRGDDQRQHAKQQREHAETAKRGPRGRRRGNGPHSEEDQAG